MSSKTQRLIIFIATAFLIGWIGLGTFITLSMQISDINSYVPNCQEDEVIYYDNYPDKDTLVCIHMDYFTK